MNAKEIFYQNFVIKCCDDETGDRIEAEPKDILELLELARQEGRQEVLKEQYEECSNCKKRKPDVSHREDAYAQEIGGDRSAMHTVCDDCDYQNRMDI